MVSLVLARLFFLALVALAANALWGWARRVAAARRLVREDHELRWLVAVARDAGVNRTGLESAAELRAKVQRRLVVARVGTLISGERPAWMTDEQWKAALRAARGESMYPTWQAVVGVIWRDEVKPALAWLAWAGLWIAIGSIVTIAAISQ